jgi:hypothetical protein
METLLILTLLSLVLIQTPGDSQNQSGLEVLSLNVKAQVFSTQLDLDSGEPPDSVTRPNPNANRPTDRTETESARLERQTNQRIQNMHTLENLKRDPSQHPSIIKVYESEAEMRNNSAKTITGFVWAYQASPALQYTEDQEFVCAVKVTAGERKRVKVISIYPNQKIVSVSGTGAVSKPVKPTLKDVLINQVEFADGTSWKRPNWDPVVLLRLGAAKLGKGKCVQF